MWKERQRCSPTRLLLFYPIGLFLLKVRLFTESRLRCSHISCPEHAPDDAVDDIADGLRGSLKALAQGPTYATKGVLDVLAGCIAQIRRG